MDDLSAPTLNGLILIGGKSSRMKTDKSELNYHGKNQKQYLFDLLSSYCSDVFISCNAQQAAELPADTPFIEDAYFNHGPAGGILSAFKFRSNAAWLTVACDLPYLSRTTIDYLVTHRNPSKTATAFLNDTGEFPEPLITIWEPKSYLPLLQFLNGNYKCPRKFLMTADVELLQAPHVNELRNVNTPEECEEAMLRFKTGYKV